MTAKKMKRILDALESYGVSLNGMWIGATSGGEIELDPGSQLDKPAHDYLLKKGFVYGGVPFNPTTYAYRP